MLTRFKVSGFKNLIDVDVRFGPFTCIAGANATGKSNLFDAIGFLSALANDTLVGAASSVRGDTRHPMDIRSLFHHAAGRYAPEISFEAVMIVPSTGVDDLGQDAQASITFLRYSLIISCRNERGSRDPGELEIRREELTHINQKDAKINLPFYHQAAWRKSVVKGARRQAPFISTEIEGERRVIKLHQDGRQGKPRQRSASDLPRTMLSASNAAENPTVLLARREMQSWRLLQLEPAALGKPCGLRAPKELGTDGSHLASALFYHAHENGSRLTGTLDSTGDAIQIYTQVANRLAGLIEDIREITVDEDPKRELLTLVATDRNNTRHSARVLSDGTLRFLALAVLELDPRAQGLICLEEPENGIHPERIPAMLDLLQDVAVDTTLPIGADNPMRQIIVNTHSPAVVGQVPDNSLLVAQILKTVDKDRRYCRASFACLPDTWREKTEDPALLVPKGKLLVYLNPIGPLGVESGSRYDNPQAADEQMPPMRRVADRPDLQLLLPFSNRAVD